MKTTKLPPLTASQLARLSELRTANDANRAAWLKFTAKPHTCATEEQGARIDAEAPFSNELRAELEMLLLLSTEARREFLYPSTDGRTLTGWMGNVLMRVESVGREFRSNMGDTRRAVRATSARFTEPSPACVPLLSRAPPLRPDC